MLFSQLNPRGAGMIDHVACWMNETTTLYKAKNRNGNLPKAVQKSAFVGSERFS